MIKVRLSWNCGGAKIIDSTLIYYQGDRVSSFMVKRRSLILPRNVCSSRSVPLPAICRRWQTRSWSLLNHRRGIKEIVAGTVIMLTNKILRPDQKKIIFFLIAQPFICFPWNTDSIGRISVPTNLNNNHIWAVADIALRLKAHFKLAPAGAPAKHGIYPWWFGKRMDYL